MHLNFVSERLSRFAFGKEQHSTDDNIHNKSDNGTNHGDIMLPSTWLNTLPKHKEKSTTK